MQTVGIWRAGNWLPAFSHTEIAASVTCVRQTLHIVQDRETGRLGVARGGAIEEGDGLPLVAALPPIYPEWLGDRSFLEVHRVRFPYVTGAMANGIATTDIVIAMARAGMLGFFGAAGLTHARIEAAIDRLEAALAGTGHPFGCNLIHSPNEPELEMGTVEIYLRRGIRRVSAAAYMGLNPMVVRYAYSGIRELSDGSIYRENYVFAKISRPEVARRFLSPAPAEILDKLVADGHLTPDEARLARRLPVAEDLIVESDSGGHTDNRPLGALFPIIAALRDAIVDEYGYARPIRLGAAGGLGTPVAVASAFQMGAAFVLTGSVNQACVESGLSPHGKQLLCNAGMADVVMAPAADMFELGVEVQVLRRGTMFGVRAKKLYDAYTAYDSLDDIPADERARLERELFKAPLDTIWERCEAFFSERDPAEVARANREPKHKMALVFRWYLGLSSKWAIAGESGREMDYQVWCGPAMGAFNDWVRGSFLEAPQNRSVVQVARNLLEGAAVLTRAQQLRSVGVPVPSSAFQFTPRPLAG